MVNHEIETIQSLKDAVDIIRSRNKDTVIHIDTVDVYTRLPIDFKKARY